MIGRREKAEILTRYDGIPVWRVDTAPPSLGLTSTLSLTLRGEDG